MGSGTPGPVGMAKAVASPTRVPVHRGSRPSGARRPTFMLPPDRSAKPSLVECSAGVRVEKRSLRLLHDGEPDPTEWNRSCALYRPSAGHLSWS